MSSRLHVLDFGVYFCPSGPITSAIAMSIAFAEQLKQLRLRVDDHDRRLGNVEAGSTKPKTDAHTEVETKNQQPEQPEPKAEPGQSKPTEAPREAQGAADGRKGIALSDRLQRAAGQRR